jgi:hypothetical protein
MRGSNNAFDGTHSTHALAAAPRQTGRVEKQRDAEVNDDGEWGYPVRRCRAPGGPSGRRGCRGSRPLRNA